jgi:hypothetical protein
MQHNSEGTGETDEGGENAHEQGLDGEVFEHGGTREC